MSAERIGYGGWPNCYRLTNGEAELVVTTDVGPRIMRYGYVGGQNLFAEFEGQLGTSGEAVWVPRGGHRIWIAPEDVERTYAADNASIQADVDDNSITLIAPVEPGTGLQKQIRVSLAETGTNVKVLHTIRNAGEEPLSFAPWALSMMAPGGSGITGFPPRGTHPEQLLPSNPLVMWAFTDLTDPRWTFTRKYVVLRQDPANKGQPQKIGHFNERTWGAYLLGTDMFVKQYTADPARTYPDFQSSFECFSNQDVLELETLGPLSEVAPGDQVTHLERWSLHSNVKIHSWTDDELDRVFNPLFENVTL